MFFFISGGKVVTHPLTHNILPGITRVMSFGSIYSGMRHYSAADSLAIACRMPAAKALISTWTRMKDEPVLVIEFHEVLDGIDVVQGDGSPGIQGRWTPMFGQPERKLSSKPAY
jgi:hypothetical protein